MTMQVTDTLLGEIVRRVLTVVQAERIVLFGSAVYQDIGPDSDLDLLIIERNSSDIRRDTVAIRRAVGDVGVPVDVVVMETNRFEQTKDMIGGLAYPAHKYGRVLYGST